MMEALGPIKGHLAGGESLEALACYRRADADYHSSGVHSDLVVKKLASAWEDIRKTQAQQEVAAHTAIQNAGALMQAAHDKASGSPTATASAEAQGRSGSAPALQLATCSVEGCSRVTWNGKANEECCRTCKASGGSEHGSHCKSIYFAKAASEMEKALSLFRQAGVIEEDEKSLSPACHELRDAIRRELHNQECMAQGASKLKMARRELEKKSLNGTCLQRAWDWRCRAVDMYDKIESPSARKDELHAQKSKALEHFDRLMEEIQLRAVKEGDSKVLSAKKRIKEFGLWQQGGLASGVSSVIYARKELTEAIEQYDIGKEKTVSEAIPRDFVEQSRQAEAERLLRLVEKDEKRYNLAGGADEWKAGTI